MSARRRMVVWAPQWALSVAAADYPPDVVAVVATPRCVLDVSPSAHELGVRAGMRMRQARTLAPDLVVLPPDPDRDARAFDAVVRALRSIRWDVSAWRPGLAQAGIGRLTEADSEPHLAAEATEAVAYEAGIDVSVGIADGTLAGLLAAHRGVIVPRGTQADFLRPFPTAWVGVVAAAGPERQPLEEFLSELVQLGLDTIGQIADLPAGALASRFGRRGQLVDALARGEDWALDGRACADTDLVVISTCDPPLTAADQALFHASTMASDLLERTRSRGVTPVEVRIGVHMASGISDERRWMLSPPVSAADLVRRLRWQLSDWLSRPAAGEVRSEVTRLEIAAVAVLDDAAAGATLWGTASGESARGTASAGVARLQQLVGRDAVMRVGLQGGFDPRSHVVLDAWDGRPSPRYSLTDPWRGALVGPAPATIYDDPRPVGLTSHTGVPVRVVDGALSAPVAAVTVRLGCSETVRTVHGPYSVNGMWWAPDGDQPSRAYLQVRTDAGHYLLVWRDQSWWHEGTYAS